jgi:purine-binding chemotaxis protein CheW
MSEAIDMTRNALASEGEALQVLTFDLGGETFALDAGVVREVIDLTSETRVPGAAPFVDAVINFRGRVIPLADLRLAFGITCGAPTVDSRIVVIEFELKGGDATHVGLRADKVHEVTLLPLADTEGPPSVGLRWRADFIRCLAKQGGELIVVPDLSQIFATRGGASATVVPFAQA